MTVVEEALNAMDEEKHTLRVLEAKSLLKRIRGYENEISLMRHRLAQLDDGAEPNTIDQFTGDTFGKHKVIY